MNVRASTHVHTHRRLELSDVDLCLGGEEASDQRSGSSQESRAVASYYSY
jgi:hypothetical protein